ncbi:ComEC/Rec2 family competence protein [Ancylothrix sp. C2]|uniref:ComEC/Rec2 family competence protein n=1 Tax=Ancylothrix sp. D3o TaxID=2953691 RepID=UPI0021BBAE9D|nr:ComEC/Rec2 family competence protein [Ancylothrix sp. D3o]MCT7952313.1 ComEC/Rec2 family competence protein [Ancylothrix sp. D3o]
MSATGVALLCFAYILGLLSTAISAQVFRLPAGGVILLALSVAAFFVVPRFWRTGPKAFLWLIAGIIGLVATLYFQWRIPQPAANDISHFVPPNSIQTQNSQFLQEPLMILAGNVESMPRLTRSGKAQFWLDATSFTEIITSQPPQTNEQEQSQPELQGVTGKVYITAPLLQATGLRPGQFVELTGILYKPQPPANPGAFDFQAYLAKEGCFAGFRARQVNIPEGQNVSKYGWWLLRRHIARIQVDKLGVPEGPLVSAMTLGKEAVDLPYDVRDWFAQVGLAHAVAASGAQVSLILSVVLALTKRLSDRLQFGVGIAAIIIFTGLAGFEPAVSRAALMGVGALLALLTDRKVKPLGSLLLAGTFLLLFNPGWIWDIGFNLSFLATLGLVVTVPGILARLDWLPTTIASVIAVPLAASLWTLPLQLYTFNVISPYSIIVNIITAPLIAVISLGGFISAFTGFFVPTAGSALAYLLFYPTHWLIKIAEYFSQLPGNSVAVGAISVVQLVTLYGLIILVWILSLWQAKQKQASRFQKGKKKKNQKKSFNFLPYVLGLSFVVAVVVVVVPAWQTKISVSRVTVLATNGEPVLVFEDKGEVTLIKSGDENTARFTVLSFLQERGVNQIDWGLALNSQLKSKQAWDLVSKAMPIKSFYGIINNDKEDSKQSEQSGFFQELPVGQTVALGGISVRVLNTEAPVVLLEIQGQNWLWLGNLKPTEQEKLAKTIKLENLQVLWWSGKALKASLIEVLEPAFAIASSRSVDAETTEYLKAVNAELYWTGRDGAIEWTGAGGFQKTLDGEAKNGLL